MLLRLGIVYGWTRGEIHAGVLLLPIFCLFLKAFWRLPCGNPVHNDFTFIGACKLQKYLGRGFLEQ